MPILSQSGLRRLFGAMVFVGGLWLAWGGVAYAQAGRRAAGPRPTDGSGAVSESHSAPTVRVRTGPGGGDSHSGSASTGSRQMRGDPDGRSRSRACVSEPVCPIVCYPTPTPEPELVPDYSAPAWGCGQTSFTLTQRIRFDFGPAAQVAVFDHSRARFEVRSASWYRPLEFEMLDGHWTTIYVYDSAKGRWGLENWQILKFVLPGSEKFGR